jgi:hypothetical protein
MSRKIDRRLLLVLAGGFVLPALAQNAAAVKKKKDVAAQYSGGGIRGAMDDAPENWLVSPAEALEYQGEEGFNERPALRMRSVIPMIDILQPQPGAEIKVKAPFTIAAQFTGQVDAPIDPSTFRVLYGAKKFDITGKITQTATITREGFKLENAQIPVGKHRLILQVQDEKRRIAERELRLEVE